VEDDNGNIVRETMKDNDVLTQYKNMRETLVYLSNLDHDDTERQMLERLRAQMAGSWTWNGLNTLCWAIGSISGSMAVSGFDTEHSLFSAQGCRSSSSCQSNEGHVVCHSGCKFAAQAGEQPVMLANACNCTTRGITRLQATCLPTGHPACLHSPVGWCMMCCAAAGGAGEPLPGHCHQGPAQPV